MRYRFICLLAALVLFSRGVDAADSRLLYVVVPGIHDKAKEGILVYDIDHDHKLLRRIAIPIFKPSEQPDDSKGLCICTSTNRIYYSHANHLNCVDLKTEQTLWEKTYDSGCDRMAMTPDGRTLYMPSGYWTNTPYWYVIDGESGEVRGKIDHAAGAHNTLVSLDGSRVYLEGLKDKSLAVVDTKTDKVIGHVGPMGNIPRPFTINAAQTLAFVCVDGLLGFEVADLKSGKSIHRVEVEGFKSGSVASHGCPSHGVGLTPDEKEVWVVDAHNKQLHVFDATALPPKPVSHVALENEPYWVTFSIDGTFAYPSTGDVVDVKGRKILSVLKDEDGKRVQSEKMVEVDFADGKAVRNGDQFGVGRAK